MTVAGRLFLAIHRDTAGTAEWLRSLGQTHAHVVVADIYDKTPSILAVADAVLDGMGKKSDLFSLHRGSEPLAAAWIRTKLPLTIVVPDAQLLSTSAITDSTAWLTSQGADVWLCGATRSVQYPNESTTRLRAVLEQSTAVQVATMDELRGAIRKRKGKPAKASTGWPRVPRVDGISFRDWARKLLEPAAFERVDAEFVRAARRIYNQLPPPFEEAARARKVWPILRSEILGADDAEHLVIVVRAAQVALLHRGWHMHVDTTLLLGAAAVHPTFGQFDSNDDWRRYEDYRDPDIGAVAALYLAGADKEFIRNLTVGRIELHADVRTPLHFATLEDDIHLDGSGAAFVRTLAVYRQLCGAAADDPLFVTSGKRDIGPKHLPKILAIPAAEVGVAAVRGRVLPAQPTAEVLVRQRFGISLRWLAKNQSVAKEAD